MLTKLKGLSTRAKIALGSGFALLIAAGVGLGIWQPWNQDTEPADEPDRQQQAQEPQAPAEKGLSVKAGSEDVPCTLYEGDGWSIYVPDGWTAERLGENGALFSSGDGAQMSVRFEPGSDYMGSFINLSAGSGDERMLQFYEGSGEGSPAVEGSAPKASWNRYEKLFAALARTLTVGNEKPFEENFVLPQEPDWQEAEGLTVLFLDKDGYILDEKAQSAVESYMLSWLEETKAAHTGQYRLNGVDWACTYTGLGEGYIDVFRADAQYQTTEGGWSEGTEDVYLAIFHDGGSVAKTAWNAAAPLGGAWDQLAAMLA